MPRLGRRERDAHRLGVPHLADDEHVGRLAHRGAQRRREIRSVQTDLDLLDEAPVMRVLVLDRVLDRDDVPGVALVDLLDEGGERRRLAGARGASDQHEAARQPRQRLGSGRKAQRGEARRPGGERPDGGRRAAPLAVEVDPEPAEPRDLVGTVGDLALLETGAHRRVQRRQNGLVDLLARRAALPAGPHGAVHPDRRGRSGNEEQVAASPPVERRRASGRGASGPPPRSAPSPVLSSRISRLMSSVSSTPGDHTEAGGPGCRVAATPPG